MDYLAYNFLTAQFFRNQAVQKPVRGRTGELAIGTIIPCAPASSARCSKSVPDELNRGLKLDEEFSSITLIIHGSSAGMRISGDAPLDATVFVKS